MKNDFTLSTHFDKYIYYIESLKRQTYIILQNNDKRLNLLFLDISLTDI